MSMWRPSLNHTDENRDHDTVRNVCDFKILEWNLITKV